MVGGSGLTWLSDVSVIGDVAWLAFAESVRSDPSTTTMSEQQSKWHFIRPWHPRLSLFVKEITSVSATFVIVSLAGRDHFEPDDGPASTSSQSVVPDPLSKGVSVKVNGTPWPKCLARLSDNADEAMIIVYGLMPGRHYDIELGLIAGEKLRGQIVTESVGVCWSLFSYSMLSAHFANS